MWWLQIQLCQAICRWASSNSLERILFTFHMNKQLNAITEKFRAIVSEFTEQCIRKLVQIWQINKCSGVHEISTNAVGCMFAKIRIDVTSNCLAKLEGYRLRIHHSQLASQLLMSWNDEFLMNHHCVGFYSEYRRTMVVISDSFVVVFVYKEANKQPHLRMVQVDVQRSRQTSKTSPSAYGSAHRIRARTNSKYKTRFLRT